MSHKPIQVVHSSVQNSRMPHSINLTLSQQSDLPELGYIQEVSLSSEHSRPPLVSIYICWQLPLITKMLWIGFGRRDTTLELGSDKLRADNCPTSHNTGIIGQ